MPDRLTIEYHAEDHLPGEAVAMIETYDHVIHVYMSAAYPLEVVAAHMTPLVNLYRQAYHVTQDPVAHLVAV